MFLSCSPFTWNRLWQRLIGPLPQDAVRPEDDRRRSLGVAVAEAWEEGWPNFEWRGQTYQTQPTARLVPGRKVLPRALPGATAQGDPRVTSGKPLHHPSGSRSGAPGSA